MPRPQNRGGARRGRRKKTRTKKKLQCRFLAANPDVRPIYVDYKDLKTLKQLVDREGRIMPRRRTGTSALYQRAVRKAILRARFIGLMPYIAEE